MYDEIDSEEVAVKWLEAYGLPEETMLDPIMRHKYMRAAKLIESRRLRAAEASTRFEKNLEEALDQRRTAQNIAYLQQLDHCVDFSSNDFLSLSTNGMLRNEFLAELARHPGFPVGSTGSRLLDGNNEYMEDLEEEIAEVHHAATATIVSSGYDANVAIFSAIPRPGDVIVHDELIHASVHDGLKHSLTRNHLSFRHNAPESLREVLEDIEEAYPLIRKGQRSVLVSVESVYSMDGDVCPLREMVEVAKEVFPRGNVQFIVDEAHSTGLLGENGEGLVCSLGLEKDIAIRLHTYGKGLSTTGAAILSGETVKNMLLNFARCIIYTTSPSFPALASIRAGYNLLRAGQLCPLRDRMQQLVKHFYKTVSADPAWTGITAAGTCSIPLLQGWEQREAITQFVPVWTRAKYNYFLAVQLQEANMSAIPINPPVVPRGTGRVRLIIHAGNTEKEVEDLAAVVLAWAKEMHAIETAPAGHFKVPSVLGKMHTLMTLSGIEVPSIANAAGNAFLE